MQLCEILLEIEDKQDERKEYQKIFAAREPKNVMDNSKDLPNPDPKQGNSSSYWAFEVHSCQYLLLSIKTQI